MSFVSFNRLFIKKQYRALAKDRDVDVIGYDTETQEGLCKLIASPCDYCHPRKADDIFHFLTSKRRRGKTGFFFNLNYDFQAILKWLPPSDWKTIAETGKVTYGEYILDYIPGKHLGIRRFYGKKRKGQKGRRARVFHIFDIAQFFKSSLNAAAKKYLGKEKTDVTGFDMTDLQNADFQHPVFIAYCQQDALLAQELTEYWIKLCHDNDLWPNTFYSIGSIGERYFLQNCKIPTINRFIFKKKMDFVNAAWLCCHGAQITTYKRGYFPQVYEYDINSAYPHTIRSLPDIDCGLFYKRSGDPPAEAVMGWLKVRIDLEEDSPGFYFPPFTMSRPKLKSNFNPYGSFTTCITLKEYLTYRSDMSIRPIVGVYWKPEGEIVYPYKDAINDIYARRQRIDKKKDFAVNYFLKIIMNSYYGKTLQKTLIRDPKSPDYGKYRTGKVFNPFYSSYILADTRLALYQALKQVRTEDIIGCYTDSVMLKREYPELDQGPGLGNWVLETSGELLIIGCGVYTMLTQAGIKTKLRGFHTTSKFNLFDEAKKQAKGQRIIIPGKQVMSFKTALTRHRENDMNTFIDYPKYIEINFDQKRLWASEFKRVGDSLDQEIDSLPLMFFN